VSATVKSEKQLVQELSEKLALEKKQAADKKLAQENLETFQEWKRGIPDYEKRLYDRVKKINKRTVNIQRSVIISAALLIIVISGVSFYIFRRVQAVTIAPPLKAPVAKPAKPIPAEQSPKITSRQIMKKRKLRIYVGSILVFIGLCGFLIYLTEELLIQYHGKMSEFAATSQAVEDKSHMAYETPGQNHLTYSQISRMQYNYFLGYWPAPNTRGNGYDINNAHFRYSENLLPSKEPNEIRVFVTGGSAAFGAGANQEQLYTNVAETLFKNKYPGKKIRIICAGVGAYTSTQERIFIENHILKYEPDIIVMYSGWNDAYYTGEGKDILEDGDHNKFQRYIYRNSDIVRTERGKILYTQPDFPNFPSYRWKILWAIDKVIYDFREYTYTRPVPVSPNDLMFRIKHNVRLVKALSKEFDFSLIYYLQPNMDATRKPQGPSESTKLPKNDISKINLDKAVDNYLVVTYYMLRDQMPKMAQQENFRFYDADHAIENEPQSVFIDTVHMGDRGQRLVGHELFRIVEQELRRLGHL